MSNPLKVLMFGWEFPPFNSGGLGTACLGLTKALSSNAEILFVLPKKVPLKSSHTHFRFADEFFPGVSVAVINSLLRPYLAAGDYERIRRGEAPIYGLNLLEEVKLYALRARELASEVRFDVIHAHDWLAFGAGIAAKQISGKPLVVHVHATEFDRTGGNGLNQEVFELEKAGMEAADAVITVSDLTRRVVIDRYGILPHKVFVVHNGIDPLTETPDISVERLEALKEGGKKIVLFVGRLTLQKGPDYFLRAAARVLQKFPNVRFVIAGSGDMQTKIMREAAHLRISDKVIFAGFARGEDLATLYRAADLFVMPSVSEPFGLTALEAAQYGTPVLMSKQSGVSEVLHHAIKVDFWDIEAMADAMAGVLYHESLANTLRKNATRELPSVSWTRAAALCLGIYKKLVEVEVR